MDAVGKPITCKAAVVWEFDKNFRIETIEVQPPQYGEVRVKICATGFCHSDLSSMRGYLPYRLLPYVAGHEGAGIVESVGPGVTTVQPGDKVLTLFMAQCRRCRVCKDGRTNVCMDIGRKGDFSHLFNVRVTGVDGTTRFSCKGQPVYHTLGTSSLSEYTVIPETSCVKVNPKTPLEKACILACGVACGYGASTNAVVLKPGDSAAVWGLGGAGMAAVMGCRDNGASIIIGIDVNPEKEAKAKKLGCTHFICTKDLTKPIEEVIIDLTNGGLDFAIVCIGNPEAMENAARSTRPGGSTVIVGLAPKDKTMTISPSFLLAGRKIIGSFGGGYKIVDDVPKLVDRYLEGTLPLEELITGYYTLEQINEAVEVMKAGQSIRSIILMSEDLYNHIGKEPIRAYLTSKT